jgi:hypothetical protein
MIITTAGSSLIMLQDKPSHVDIPENQWKEMMQNILNGIFRKLNAVKNILTIDMYIAAGLYIYAVEEFGKLLLIKNVNELDGMRKVVYEKEFLSHTKKFKAAFYYFQANRYDACLVLSEGDVVPSDVVWSDAIIGLLANTGARLSVFYSDFTHDKSLNIIIETPPAIDLDLVRKASNELERASKEFHI